MSAYRDHNASSPMHADAIDAMLPFTSKRAGNPPSLHAFERTAHAAVESVSTRVVERKSGPLPIGGSDQEHEHRVGTKYVAGIAGPGKAAELAGLEIEQCRHHLRQLRKVFETGLSRIPASIGFGDENSLRCVGSLATRLQQPGDKLPAVSHAARRYRET